MSFYRTFLHIYHVVRNYAGLGLMRCYSNSLLMLCITPILVDGSRLASLAVFGCES